MRFDAAAARGAHGRRQWTNGCFRFSRASGKNYVRSQVRIIHVQVTLQYLHDVGRVFAPAWLANVDLPQPAHAITGHKLGNGRLRRQR